MRKKTPKQEVSDNQSQKNSKWIYISWSLSFVLALVVTIQSFYYNASKQKLDRQVLAYNISPKIAVNFKYDSGDSSYFLIKNLGPSELEDYWIEEKVYLVTDTTVYECSDAPRFQFLQYEGSMRSMGNLALNSERKVFLSSCWREFMGRISSKFTGRLVSRFWIRGSSLHSPEYYQESYFVIDVGNKNYTPIREINSGEKLFRKIREYNAKGPRSIVKWVTLDSSFWINPPIWWYTYDHNNWLPWIGEGSPIGKVGISAKRTLPFTPFSVEPRPGQSVRRAWFCDSLFAPGIIISGSE